MNPVALFVTLIAASALSDDVEQQQRFMKLHHVWQDAHWAADNAHQTVDSVLVIDSSKSSIWIENDGKIDESLMQALPAGLEWSAYVITERGCSEIPFPVRIKNPRRDSRDANDTEQIWILGANKKRQWQFSISGTKNGHHFHVGSGNGPFMSYKFQLPEHDAPVEVEEALTTSILDSQKTSERTWSDKIRTKWYSFDITRTKTNP